MRGKAAALALTVVTLATVGAPFADTVREIRVEENAKTTDATVVFIAGIERGDDWDADIQEAVRLELISSGLFKEVEIYSEPHPKGGMKVTIVARDKHSWVIAPTVYNQPTNRGGGIGFGENNLLGTAKKLLLYGQLATGDSFFIGALIDPSIGGTPLRGQLDVFLQNERIIEYAAPSRYRDNPAPVRRSRLHYLNAGAKLGVTVLRGVSFDVRLRGAKVSFVDARLVEGAREEDVGVAAGEAIPEPGAEGYDVSTEAILSFDGRANYYGITTGSKLTLTGEKAQPGLGSDFKYWYATAGYQKGFRYWSRHNLVFKTGIGYGRDIPFQHERNAGGTDLRGYLNDQFRGDFKASGGLEYSWHFFHMPMPVLGRVAVRGLGFVDSAYTRFLDIEESDSFRNYLPGHDRTRRLDPFKNSVGGGIRLFARSIVLPLLGLDVGYGLESGGYEVYFAVGLADL